MWRIWCVPNNARKWQIGFNSLFNPLNAKLNPICYFLALLGTHHILHISRIKFKELSRNYYLFLVLNNVDVN